MTLCDSKVNPQYSIIIPACNEESFITGAVNSVRQSAQLALVSIEIIVVINRCADATEDVARNLGCIIVHNDSKNLSSIRNSGAKIAKGEVIVTLDADSRVSTNMFQRIHESLAHDTIIGGGTIIIPERWSLGIALTGLFLVPAILFERLSGGLFFVRREDFFAVEGFNEELYSAEDLDFARRLKKHAKNRGRKFITLWRAHIITSCRKFDKFGDWYFLKNPIMVLKLLRGKDKRYADIVWYDFHKKE